MYINWTVRILWAEEQAFYIPTFFFLKKVWILQGTFSKRISKIFLSPCSPNCWFVNELGPAAPSTCRHVQLLRSTLTQAQRSSSPGPRGSERGVPRPERWCRLVAEKGIYFIKLKKMMSTDKRKVAPYKICLRGFRLALESTLRH